MTWLKGAEALHSVCATDCDLKNPKCALKKKNIWSSKEMFLRIVSGYNHKRSTGNDSIGLSLFRDTSVKAC